MTDPDGIIASRRAAAELVLSECSLAGDEQDLIVAGTARFAAAHLYEAGRTAQARRELGHVRRLGVLRFVRLAGRLWIQTLLGRRVSRWARCARATLRAWMQPSADTTP